MKRVFLPALLLLIISSSLVAQVAPDLEESFAWFPVPQEDKVFYSTLDFGLFQHPENKEIKAFRDIIQHTYLYWLGMPDTFDDRLISYSRGVFGRKSTYEVIVFNIFSPAETIAKLADKGVIVATGEEIGEEKVYHFPIKKGADRTSDYYLMVMGYDLIFMSNEPSMLERMVEVKKGKENSAVKDPRFKSFIAAAKAPCFDYSLTDHTMVIRRQLMDVEAKKEKLKHDLVAIDGMKKMMVEGPQITFQYTAFEDGIYLFQREERYGTDEFANRFLTYNNSKAEQVRNIAGHRNYWDLREAKTIWRQKGNKVIGKLIFDQLLIDKARDWWADKIEEDNPEEQY